MTIRSLLLAPLSATFLLLACSAPYAAADEDPECDPATSDCGKAPATPATSSNPPTGQAKPSPTAQDTSPTEPVPPPPPASTRGDGGARDASTDG